VILHKRYISRERRRRNPEIQRKRNNVMCRVFPNSVIFGRERVYSVSFCLKMVFEIERDKRPIGQTIHLIRHRRHVKIFTGP